MGLDNSRQLDIALLCLLGAKKIHFHDWDEERDSHYSPWRQKR